MEKGLYINEMLKALNLDCIGDDRYRNATDGALAQVVNASEPEPCSYRLVLETSLVGCG